MAEEEKKEENKKEEKKGLAEAKKKTLVKKEKKEAIVNGRDLPLSKKHCMAICDFIRGRGIEESVRLIEAAAKMKIAVPMKGEIPHRKGKIMSGRYPVKACKEFLKLLKQLSSNASVNEMEIEKGIIECKADKASRPYKRFGSMKFKRTHVTLKLIIKEKNKSKRKKKH